MLSKNSTLKQFGSGGKTIYVGIAKDSLKRRDLNNHFKTCKTGYSTLRRSIGAVLKEKLSLTALTRNGTLTKKAINNFKFQSDGDQRFSNWMESNLVIGYWEDHNNIPYKVLRQLEEDVTKEVKPTLDLDNRTKRFNPLAPELFALRKICKLEAVDNVISGDTQTSYLIRAQIIMEKREIAIKQLRAATKHYNEGDYICSITLSGAAEEILGKIAKKRTGRNQLDREIQYLREVYKYLTGNAPDNKDLIKKINRIKNELKHNDSGKNEWLEADFENEAAGMFVKAVKNYHDAYNEFPPHKIINKLFESLSL